VSSDDIEEEIAVASGDVDAEESAPAATDLDPAPAVEVTYTVELLDEEPTATGDADPQATGAEQAAGPRQGEMPFAMVAGKAFTDLPSDLYIPPDALEVILEAFEGPLDLLLYLIRRQNLDILAINVADITRQYMSYVEMMTAMRFELAAEYLVMAAMLAEIKSRMLLPRPPEAEEEEGEDPRAALIRRLQEYERFKTAAEDMDELPRMGRDIHQASATGPDRKLTRPEPEVDLKEVLLALSDVLRRADMFESHQVEREKLSTRERMTQVLDKIRHRQFVPFVALFRAEEGRLGVVVTFLAVMELVKESLVELVQNEAFGAIHVRSRGEVQKPSDDLDLASDSDFGDDDFAGDDFADEATFDRDDLDAEGDLGGEEDGEAPVMSSSDAGDFEIAEGDTLESPREPEEHETTEHETDTVTAAAPSLFS
jgi:segregation and condensation protein A